MKNTLNSWLNGLRTRSVPKPRRVVLNVPGCEEKCVPAALAGSVYVDSNCNGVRECGEAGIPGVTVVLFGKTDCGQSVCQTTKTDCNGNYSFTNLAAGNYNVSECQPSNYRDGKDTAGTAGGAATDDKISCIRLENCTTATGYNFGEKPACPPAPPACSNGSHGKGSSGKGSSGKGSSDKACGTKGSHSKGSSGKGSSGKGDHKNGSSGKGDHKNGSSGKGSSGKGDHSTPVCTPVSGKKK